jgi:Flp pilus assembly protein TadD
LLVRIYARVGDDSRAPTDAERLLLEEGRAEAVRALEHSTAPHLVFAELGNLSLRLGDLLGGERAFREATSVAPNYWYAHARLAHLLSVRGDGEAARTEAARALALNPESDLVKDLIRRLEAE